jgi:hypothetical protein
VRGRCKDAIIVRQTLFFAEECVPGRQNSGEYICGGFVIVYLPPIRNVQSESRSKFQKRTSSEMGFFPS